MPADRWGNWGLLKLTKLFTVTRAAKDSKLGFVTVKCQCSSMRHQISPTSYPKPHRGSHNSDSMLSTATKSHEHLHSPPFQSQVEATSRNYQGTLLVCRWALLPTSLYRCSPKKKQESREWEMGQARPERSDVPFRENGALSLRPLCMWQWLLRLSPHKPQSQRGEQKLKCARASGWDSKPTAAFRCPESKDLFFSPFKYWKACIFFILILLK